MINAMFDRRLLIIPALALLFFAVGCTMMDEDNAPVREDNSARKVNFDMTVTRDGQSIPRERITRSTVNTEDKLATMDPDKPFGIIGIDAESGALLVDNQKVYSSGGNYSTWFEGDLWKARSMVTFSAYYPHVSSVVYESGNEAYTIPFSVQETEAGPLVSKTMQQAVDQLNMISLEFQHITNDIGFKVCDVTPDAALQGLIHLRKLTAVNVASAGTFVNDLGVQRGFWHRVGYYRDVVVFEGDALVGVGSENEKFVGYSTLEDRLSDSHRYYSIPDEIKLGKQFVEVVFDVDGFTLNGFDYPPIKNQVSKYSLYGLLPDNVFVYGKQYTFHIGLDLSTVYKEITFSPSISGWETKIYENNDDF